MTALCLRRLCMLLNMSNYGRYSRKSLEGEPLINSTGVLMHVQENMGASVVPTLKLWGKTGLWGEEPRKGSPWATRVTSH